MNISLIIMQRIFVLWQSIAKVLLGGWDGLLSALILVMAVEYATQLLVAILSKKVSGEIGFLGIAKKISVFLLVAVGNVIDTLVNQKGGMMRTAVIFFYISYEGGLILENVTLIGLPIPQEFLNILERIKDKVIGE